MSPNPSKFLELLPEEARLGTDGRLSIGGVALETLAEEYGTPLHVIDEAGLRRQMQRFVSGLSERWPNSSVLFASKSLPVQAIYAIAHSQGMAIDVAGGGELELALAARVPSKQIYFHGNAKTDAEVQRALRAGISTFIVDNPDELDRLEKYVTRTQQVLLRVIPQIDAATHASQATGGADSKFGVHLEEIGPLIERIHRHPFLNLDGVHIHIGSQILQKEQFGEAVRRISEVGIFDTYNIGGGLGVRYTYSESAPSVESYLDTVVASARNHLPASAKLIIEPGRSVVARAGVTLYDVVSVKKRCDASFVAVDGGLADQLDIALTQQRYEIANVSKFTDAWSTTANVVGRQCESGDLLVRDASLPDTSVGDLMVMPMTGAYSYTMANNYNGALKPAIVFVGNGRARLAVRRESYEDLLRTHQPSLGIDWSGLP